MSAVDRLKLRFLVAMCVVFALNGASSWWWAWSQRGLTLESQALARACTYMGPVVEEALARADELQASWDEVMLAMRTRGPAAVEIEP